MKYFEETMYAEQAAQHAMNLRFFTPGITDEEREEIDREYLENIPLFSSNSMAVASQGWMTE